jgi:hypothetical protein
MRVFNDQSFSHLRQGSVSGVEKRVGTHKTPRVSRKYLTLLPQKFFENNFVKSKNKHSFAVAFTTNSRKDYKSGFFRRAKKE